MSSLLLNICNVILSRFPSLPCNTKCIIVLVFSLTATATPDIYTLSLHDALPICSNSNQGPACAVIMEPAPAPACLRGRWLQDRKSTRLNSSHVAISYAVFCLKKKKPELYSTRWVERHVLAHAYQQGDLHNAIHEP